MCIMNDYECLFSLYPGIWCICYILYVVNYKPCKEIKQNVHYLKKMSCRKNCIYCHQV